ncbi:unnamed protein product [Brassica napus]|nr:unnamed protein product [Brassica napus]
MLKRCVMLTNFLTPSPVIGCDSGSQSLCSPTYVLRFNGTDRSCGGGEAERGREFAPRSPLFMDEIEIHKPFPNRQALNLRLQAWTFSGLLRKVEAAEANSLFLSHLCQTEYIIPCHLLVCKLDIQYYNILKCMFKATIPILLLQRLCQAAMLLLTESLHLPISSHSLRMNSTNECNSSSCGSTKQWRDGSESCFCGIKWTLSIC